METQDSIINQAANDGIEKENSLPPVEYAGFWIRFLAFLLDSLVVLLIVVPFWLYFYGSEALLVPESRGFAYYLIFYGLPAIAFIVFWQFRSATPGKIMMGIYIVDEETLGHPRFGKLVLRYLGYYVSSLLLFLGFFWVAFDKRKQGFHDKIARTLVVKQLPLTAQQLSARALYEPLSEEVDIKDDKKEEKKEDTAGQDPWKE